MSAKTCEHRDCTRARVTTSAARNQRPHVCSVSGTGAAQAQGVEACRKITVGSTGARPRSQAMQPYRVKAGRVRRSAYGEIPHHTNGSGGRGGVSHKTAAEGRDSNTVRNGEDRPRHPENQTIPGARNGRVRRPSLSGRGRREGTNKRAGGGAPYACSPDPVVTIGRARPSYGRVLIPESRERARQAHQCTSFAGKWVKQQAKPQRLHDARKTAKAATTHLSRTTPTND